VDEALDRRAAVEPRAAEVVKLREARAQGYPAKAVAVVNGGDVTAENAVASWLARAPVLKARLLNPDTTEIGVGFAQSADTANLWVVLLGCSPEARNPARAVVRENK
jgi:hypothetical protein